MFRFLPRPIRKLLPIFLRRIGLRSTAFIPAALAVLFSGSAGRAQTWAHYVGDTETVPNCCEGSAQSVAVDSSGNIYFSAINAVAGSVSIEKSTYSGGTYSKPVTLFRSGDLSTFVAVDNQQNVFVINGTTKSVEELPYSNGSYGTPVVVGGGTVQFVNPVGVVPDNSGNIFVVDSTYSDIIRVSYSGTGSPAFLNVGLTRPQAITRDAGGNLYVMEHGWDSGATSGAIKKIVKNANGTYSLNPVTLVSGIDTGHDYGLAVDSFGNLYTGTSGAVVEYVNGSSYLPVQLDGNQDIDSAGLAIDTAGSLYISYALPGSVTGSYIYKIKRYLDFPDIKMSQPNYGREENITLQVDAPTATFGTPVVTGTDFVYGGTDCFNSTFTATQTCNFFVVYQPTSAGTHSGTLTVPSTNPSNPPIQVQLRATGVAAQTTFLPGNQSSLYTGTGTSAGIAVDSTNNIWFTDTKSKALYELPRNAGQFGTPISIASGFNDPTTVVADDSGNIFVLDRELANSQFGQLYKVTANGTQSTVASSLYAPGGLAVDTQGNVYTAVLSKQSDPSVPGTYAVQKIPLDPILGYGTPITLFSVAGGPTALAVDGTGELFVMLPTFDTASTSTPGSIVKYPNAAGNYGTPQTLFTGATTGGMTLDGVGNIYFGVSGTRDAVTLEKISYVVTANASLYTSPFALTSDTAVTQLAIDRSGNLYWAGDHPAETLFELNLATPPSLTFPNTAPGSASATQAITMMNSGNADLVLSQPTTGLNPSLSNYFTYSNDSGCPQLSPSSGSTFTIFQGEFCTIGISFTPTILGSVTGNLIITDNVLGVSNAKQTVAVAGSTSSGLTVTVPAQSAPSGASPITLSFIIGWGGSVAPTATPEVTVDGHSEGSGTLTCINKLIHENCSVSFDGSYLAPGNHTIRVTEPGDGNYAAKGGTGILTITGATSTRIPSPVKAIPIAVTEPGGLSIR